MTEQDLAPGLLLPPYQVAGLCACVCHREEEGTLEAFHITGRHTYLCGINKQDEVCV